MGDSFVKLTWAVRKPSKGVIILSSVFKVRSSWKDSLGAMTDEALIGVMERRSFR